MSSPVGFGVACGHCQGLVGNLSVENPGRTSFHLVNSQSWELHCVEIESKTLRVKRALPACCYRLCPSGRSLIWYNLGSTCNLMRPEAGVGVDLPPGSVLVVRLGCRTPAPPAFLCLSKALFPEVPGYLVGGPRSSYAISCPPLWKAAVLPCPSGGRG